MTTNGTIEQIQASHLTNQALAQRLLYLRQYNARERNAYLEEAAKRLVWDDVYTRHTEQLQ